MTSAGSPDQPRKPGVLSVATAGLLLGSLVGVVFGVVDCLLAVRAGGQPDGAVIIGLITKSLAVSVPVFGVFGVACAVGLLVVRSVWHRAYKWLLVLLPLLWTIAVFAYRPAQQRRLGYLETAWWGPTALVLGLVSYAALKALAARAARSRRPLSLLEIVVGLVWLASVGVALVVGRPTPVVELPESVPASTADQPNVILIVLDTVRMDHMSCYGYSRNTTPKIDAFAQDARVYTNCLSPGCWTLPSHASLFTGLPGRAHGVSWVHQSLDEEFETLAEQLLAAGYQTAGLSSNAIVSASRSFDQGFDMFWAALSWDEEEAPTPVVFADRVLSRLGRKAPQPRSNASLMHEELGRWFAEQYRPEKPFFIFLNYIEPHGPYVPPSHLLEWATEQVRQKWTNRDQRDELLTYMLTGLDTLNSMEISELETLYDEEIRYVDGKVGELLEFLDSNGLMDNTLVVITSDHGEHFGEHHMMLHRFSLYEPLVRVPLIVRYRDRFAPGMQDGLVQTHDVYPTILELAGVDWPRLPDQNCLNLLDGGAPGEVPRRGIAEYNAPTIHDFPRFIPRMPRFDFSRWLLRMKAVRLGDSKLIRWSDGHTELYDVARDPMELRDLTEDQPDVVGRLAEELDGWVESVAEYVAKPPDPDTALEKVSEKEIEALRGLGYAR